MVSNVIDSIECKDDVVSQEYKALLVKYKEIISSIFSGASGRRNTTGTVDLKEIFWKFKSRTRK